MGKTNQPLAQIERSNNDVNPTPFLDHTFTYVVLKGLFQRPPNRIIDRPSTLIPKTIQQHLHFTLSLPKYNRSS